MLEAIRAFGAGPLEHAELTDLGRVNIICGKNNSGKTTLLAALNNSEQRAPGSLVSPDVRRQTAAMMAASSVYKDDYQDKQVYANVIEGVLTTRDRWFSNDYEHATKLLTDQIERNSILNRYAVNYELVGGTLVKRVTPDHPNTVFIPPKRHIQTGRDITLSEEVQADGSGLLNYLFFAKNQSSGDSHRHDFDRILRAFIDISSGFRFDVFPSRENRIFLRFARHEGDWIAADACGLGLQDLLLLLYFGISAAADVLLLEEPESHLHPDMQRRLLSYLRTETNKQLFVTTHSNVFLNNALIDRVFFTTWTNDKIAVDDATSRASILDDLGYSVTDNLVSDLVILVEGPSDVPVIEEMLAKSGVFGRFNIKIWPLGGDIMDQLDLSVFAQRYQIIALVDQDPESAKIRKRFEQKCKAAGIPVHRLSRYAIENYFTLAAIKATYPHQTLPANLTALDPATKVEKQLGFSVKRQSRAIAKSMSLADVEATDLGKFIKRVAKLVGA